MHPRQPAARGPLGRPTLRSIVLLAAAALLVGACSASAYGSPGTGGGGTSAAAAAGASAEAGGYGGTYGGGASAGTASAGASAVTAGAGASSAPESSGATTAAGAAPELRTSTNASLGTFLTDGAGWTLYSYTPDHVGNPPISNCTGSCAALWPPYTVAPGTHVKAGPGVTGAITTFTRSDGSTQVAYKGMPLYRYAGDTAPGQTNGQGIGGIWFVVKP